MNRFLAACLFLILPAAIHAQEPIRFARSPDIAPDGKTVAFSYLGDIWLVDVKGGEAHHLTMHEKHDFNPIFSPDGKWIAFSSNRHGQYDVFIVPVKGGRPKRLTFDSADDHPTGWSPDSQHVLFMSGRSIDLPMRAELYSISIHGGPVKQIRGTRSLTSAAPGSGIARAIAAPPMTTSGFAMPTARRIARSPITLGKTATRCGPPTANIFFMSATSRAAWRT
jgi:dipeptidyl aminopeptidase/acylaminoacyl peptidase